MKIRIFFPLFSFLFIAVTFSPAQTQTDSTRQKQTFRFPKTSLQFSLNQYSGLRSFEGGLLSAKYHFSNQLAMRLGIDSRLSNSEDNIKSEEVETDSLISKYNRTSTKNTVMILSTFLYYFNPSDEFKLFTGTGPILGISTRTQNEANSFTAFTNSKDNESLTYSAGLRFVFGLEWFFRKNMSLLAQYGFQALYSWSETETKSSFTSQTGSLMTRKTTKTTNGFNLSSGIPNLGLSLYF
jgi:hypothetical protein